MPRKLSPEAKAEIAAAMAIIKSDRATPKPVPAPKDGDPPPPKPPKAKEEAPPPKRSLIWGNRLNEGASE